MSDACKHPEFVEEFLSDEGPQCSKCGIRLSELQGSKAYYPADENSGPVFKGHGITN